MGGAPAIDLAAAEQAVHHLLLALGQNPNSERLHDTPRRVAEALGELLTPECFDFTTFVNDEGYDELVVSRGIPFQSLCEHHLLPFTGVAHVGYIPGDRLLGLSKLARVVRHFAHNLQLQERLTIQVSNWLERHLEPRGVGVILEAEHQCMTQRGVRAHGSRTITSAVHGTLRDDARSRQEFFALCGTTHLELTKNLDMSRPLARLVPRSMQTTSDDHLRCTACGEDGGSMRCECGMLCPPCWAEHRSPSACLASMARRCPTRSM